MTNTRQEMKGEWEIAEKLRPVRNAIEKNPSFSDDYQTWKESTGTVYQVKIGLDKDKCEKDKLACIIHYVCTLKIQWAGDEPTLKRYEIRVHAFPNQKEKKPEIQIFEENNGSSTLTHDFLYISEGQLRMASPGEYFTTKMTMDPSGPYKRLETILELSLPRRKEDGGYYKY